MRRPDVPGIHHLTITNCNSFIRTCLSEMAGSRTSNAQTPSSGRSSPAGWRSLWQTVQSDRPPPHRAVIPFQPLHTNTVLSLLYHYCRPTSGVSPLGYIHTPIPQVASTPYAVLRPIWITAAIIILLLYYYYHYWILNLSARPTIQ